MLNLCFPKSNLTVWCQYFNTYNYIYTCIYNVYVFIEISTHPHTTLCLTLAQQSKHVNEALCSVCSSLVAVVVVVVVAELNTMTSVKSLNYKLITSAMSKL